MPASLAIAGRCRAVFVEPPKAMSTVIAFLKALSFMICLGVSCALTRATMAFPEVFASLIRSAWTAGMVPLPGSAIPKASLRQFIEFAVNMPAQEPAPGQAQPSSSVSSCSLIEPAATLPTASNTEIRSTVRPLKRPDSIGPPLMIMAGMLRRRAAIIMPGIILSQFGMRTSPSKGYALAMTSTESATSSLDPREYFIPSWFMAMPSQMPMVENCRGRPPARRTPSLTAAAILSRCMWPGISSEAELAMPMIGRSSSSGKRPSALKSDLCGAFSIPFFILSDLIVPPLTGVYLMPLCPRASIIRQKTA